MAAKKVRELAVAVKKAVPAKPEKEAQGRYTLLIFDMVPETTRRYLVPNDIITDEHRALLRYVHGQLGGAVGTSKKHEAAINCVSSITCDSVEGLAKEHPEGSTWAMHWAKFEQPEDGPPLEGVHITHVYWTGWIM